CGRWATANFDYW
nr:immunoglobulin heavy chain junction region [Macaca mulatta]